MNDRRLDRLKRLAAGLALVGAGAALAEDTPKQKPAPRHVNAPPEAPTLNAPPPPDPTLHVNSTPRPPEPPTDGGTKLKK